MREMPLLVIFMMLVLLPACSWALGKVTVYPAPPEERPSPDYAVFANGPAGLLLHLLAAG